MSGRRCEVAAAIALTFPASTISFAMLTGTKYICASPRMTAVKASGALLNGTCTMLMPAAFLNCAPAMNVVLASPAEEKFSAPGLDFASATRSFTFLAGTSGCEIRIVGAEQTRVMPAKSCTGS